METITIIGCKSRPRKAVDQSRLEKLYGEAKIFLCGQDPAGFGLISKNEVKSAIIPQKWN